MNGGNQHIEEPFAWTHSEFCQCAICRPGQDESSAPDEAVDFSCVRYAPVWDSRVDARHYWEYGLELSEGTIFSIQQEILERLNRSLANFMLEVLGAAPPPEPATTACSDCDSVFPCADAYTSTRDNRIICETCFKTAESAGRARERKVLVAK